MARQLINREENGVETSGFCRTEMQKEMVIQKLREQGCRITKQRKILLDVILKEECTSCKEIYYAAVSVDPAIGTATVYRMVNLLEEIGAISRKNMYKISCYKTCEKEKACIIELDDDTVCQLSAGNWYKVISEGLKACGYVEEQKVTSVLVDSCGIFAAGVLFGTAGVKLLASKDAKSFYTKCTAAVLRAKESVMRTVTDIQENAEDIYAEAQEINANRVEENMEFPDEMMSEE